MCQLVPTCVVSDSTLYSCIVEMVIPCWAQRRITLWDQRFGYTMIIRNLWTNPLELRLKVFKPRARHYLFSYFHTSPEVIRSAV